MSASVIVTYCSQYRPTSVLARCLDSISANTEPPYEVTVIDGVPSRGHVWLANRGLRAAEGEPRVLLNDDVVVEPGWLSALEAGLAEDPDRLVVSATEPDGENSGLNGWCLAFSERGYHLTGGFNPNLIHYKGDWDLAQRIEDMGFKYKRIPEALVRHKQTGPPDGELLALMREWHIHDFGYPPDTW